MIDHSPYFIVIDINTNLISIVRGSERTKNNYVDLLNSIGNSLYFSEEYAAVKFVACNLKPKYLDENSPYYTKIKEKIDLIKLSKKYFKLDISRNNLKYTSSGR